MSDIDTMFILFFVGLALYMLVSVVCLYNSPEVRKVRESHQAAQTAQTVQIVQPAIEQPVRRHRRRPPLSV